MYLAHEKKAESTSCIVYNQSLKSAPLIENIISEVGILGGTFMKIVKTGNNNPNPPGPTTAAPTNDYDGCDITYIHIDPSDTITLAGTKVYLHMSESDVNFANDDYFITSSISSIDNAGIPDPYKPTVTSGRISYEFSALYNMISAFNESYALIQSLDPISLLSTFKGLTFDFGGQSTSLLTTNYFNVPTLLAKHDGSSFTVEKNMTTDPNLYYAFESTKYKICDGISDEMKEYNPYGIILLYASVGYNATSDLKVYQVLQAEVMNMNKQGGLNDKSIVVFPVNYVQDHETMMDEVYIVLYYYIILAKTCI